MDISVADQLEFESWPKEQQDLAKRYLEQLDPDLLIQVAYDHGYHSGYRAASRRREANGTND